MEIRHIQTSRQVPADLLFEIGEESGLNIIVDFPYSVRLLRKCTLANGYGLYYDLHGNNYHITPDAEKVSRDLWTGVEVCKEFFIYIKDEIDD